MGGGVDRMSWFQMFVLKMGMMLVFLLKNIHYVFSLIKKFLFLNYELLFLITVKSSWTRDTATISSTEIVKLAGSLINPEMHYDYIGLIFVNIFRK